MNLLDRIAELENKNFRYPITLPSGEEGTALVTVTDYVGFVKDKDGNPWEKVILFFIGFNNICYGAGDAAKLLPAN